MGSICSTNSAVVPRTQPKEKKPKQQHVVVNLPKLAPPPRVRNHYSEVELRLEALRECKEMSDKVRQLEEEEK